MLIDIANTHESSGLTKLCDFQIQTNGIMVKALTSRLYSNPISSVVRELASNALDANRSEPMEIRVPTLLDPSFRIRDKGPGLSRTSMVEVFTRFGESTKRNTNSQIGGFGLGAKSPFAIANSYTIVSSHAGTKTTYMASIGSDGMPSLHEVSSEPTNDTGLEIIVPAKPSPKWVEALSQIQYFEPRPIITGCTYDGPTIIHENPQYLVISGGEPSILVGPVAYPLNTSHFQRVPPFVLKFPIGTIEVTASREEIVYSPATIQRIQNAIDLHRQDYMTLQDDMVSKCTTVPQIWQILKGSIFDKSYIFGGRGGRTYRVGNTHVEIHGASYRKFNPSDRKRKRWNGTFASGSNLYFYLEDVAYLEDDNRKMQERIENTLRNQPNYGPGTDVYVVKDRTPFDDMGLPIIPLSSIPTAAPIRKASRPIAHRILNDRGALVVSPTPCTHYLPVTVVDKATYWRGVRLSRAIYMAMCRRIGGQIALITPDFKGKYNTLRDAAAEWEAAAQVFLDTEAPALALYNSYQQVDGWDTPLYVALAASGLLPPPPPKPANFHPVHYYDVQALCSGWASCNIDYKKEYLKVIRANPLFTLLDTKSWAESETAALTRIISLIK
jgi:hypothetical protein